jgi:hypothetical protein
LCATALFAGACVTPFAHAQDAPPSARVLDSIVLDPFRLDDAFGGISGVDYDSRRRRWLLLSDDRSEHAPARLYTISLERSEKGRWRLGKGRRILLRDLRGLPFPSAGLGREAVDPEAIRVAPDGESLVWASEGDAQDGYSPVVRRMDSKGRAWEQVRLPPNLRFDRAGRHGPRGNASIEGMDFSPDGALWIAMEGPLIEDGQPAAEDRPALVRFTRLTDDGTTRQFAYRLDAAATAPHGKAADNGVTEILALDNRRLLVLERSGAVLGEGRYLFRCRLYLADFAQAFEVTGLASLKSAVITPATKRLLLDFGTLPDNPGNLEAMAWWPSRQGHPARIVLLNDNNFAVGEPTRLLLLTLPPDLPVRPAR